MWARFITTDYVALLFFAVLFHVYGGDAQTDSPCEGCESKLKTYQISLYSVSAVGGFIIIVMSVVIPILVKRLVSGESPVESSDDPEQQIKVEWQKHNKVEYSDDPEQQIKVEWHKHNKGPISYYELGKLVRYAFEEKEDDKLKAAMKTLMNDDNYEIQKSKYGATNEDRYCVYQDLCDWKKKFDNPRLDQIKLLFGECIAADMVKSLRKLTDLRGRVLDVPSSFSSDLKRILLLIGKKSTDSITKLLKNLNVENFDCDHSSELQEIVDGALEKLEIWKEGLVPINPVVMLNLALEDLKLNEGRDEHLRNVESISWSLE